MKKNIFSLGFLWFKLFYEMKKKINNIDIFEYSLINFYNVYYFVCSFWCYIESYSFCCSMFYVFLKYNLVNSFFLLIYRFYLNIDLGKVLGNENYKIFVDN